MNKKWVDLQVNGHRGVDFVSPELSEKDIVQAIEELAEAGTAVFLPTLITASDELYARNVPLIKRTVEKYGLQKHVPGVHLEGPLLTCAGAHDPALQQECSAENVRKLHDLTEGFIKVMTLSAEAEGAPEAVAELKKRGIVPSVGHHTAGYAEIHRAADAGCQLLTHLGNACPNLVGRHENPLLAGLAEERMDAMIITDGHHLPADLIKIIFKVKSPDHIIVTSDACSLCGFPPGEYSLWGNRAVLTENGKLHNPDKQCLVAAAATMDMCMEFLKSLEFLSGEELLKVGRTNALKLLNMEDDL
ncbi:MAG: amidohydrolase family protein [Lentisphaeria bacterium]|nr:amidohydrolase family protein [Lentisphaeria bacterium]